MGRFTLRRNRHERDPLERYYELRLFNLRNVDARGYPQQIAVIGMLLSCLRNNVRTTADLNRAITQILTVDERAAFLGGFNYLNYDSCCSYCGEGFCIPRCRGCEAPIKDDGVTCYTGIAIPPRVRAWLNARGGAQVYSLTMRDRSNSSGILRS